MTERAQNADFRRKPQIFANSPLHLEIQALNFGGCRKPQKTADFHRKPKIFAENCRKPQTGLCHLRCVTLSLALLEPPENPISCRLCCKFAFPHFCCKLGAQKDSPGKSPAKFIRSAERAGECLTPPLLTPLVAERAFRASEHWGLKRVSEVQGK